MVTHVLEGIGKNVEKFTKQVEDKSGAMAANLIKGGQAATIAGGLITGAAIAEGTVVLKMAEHVADLGHQQFLLAEAFGLGAQQAGAWGAAADAVGVDNGSLGVGFKTLAKNMEALKLLDNAAQLKALNKEMLAGSEINPKVAAQIEVLQQRATTLAQGHVILADALHAAIVKHGAHSIEVLKATKALDANSFSITDNQQKLALLAETSTTAVTATAKQAQATLAAANAARPLQMIFDQLGVKVTDTSGKLRPMNDVMLDIATALAAMPDGAEKAGLAVKLFGRSGTDMLPLLDQGKAGIQKFMDSAVLSGKVLDDSQVKEAQAAYLAHKQLDQAISGVTTQLAMAFLPVLSKFLEVLTPMLHNMADWIKHHEKLLSVLIPLAIAVTGIIGILITVAGVIAMVGGAIMGMSAISAIAAPALAAVGAAALPVIIILAVIAAVALAVWFAITHWTQIKQIAGQVWQAIGDMVGKIGAFFGQLGDMIEHAWSEFWKRPFYYIGLVVGFVLVKAIEIHDTIIKWLKKMVVSAVAFWLELPKNAWAALTSIVTNIGKWAAQALPAMQKGAKDMGKQLLDELKKLPGQVLSIGADIAKGIVKGLTSVPGAITKGAQDFAGGLLDGIKAAAHIKSPSALFAAQVGVPIAQGIAAGIKAGLPEANAALSALVSNAPHKASGSRTATDAKHPASPATGTASVKVEELLQKILDAIINGEGIATSGGGGGSGKGALSPYDVLAAFNHLVGAAQIQRSRGTRAGYMPVGSS